MQRQEYNLNHRTWQLDVYEAHLHVREHRCDRHEVEIRVARMGDRNRGSKSESE
jgi:hypothetical protein